MPRLPRALALLIATPLACGCAVDPLVGSWHQKSEPSIDLQVRDESSETWDLLGEGHLPLCSLKTGACGLCHVLLQIDAVEEPDNLYTLQAGPAEGGCAAGGETKPYACALRDGSSLLRCRFDDGAHDFVRDGD